MATLPAAGLLKQTTRSARQLAKRKAIHMDYNENKYWVEDSDALSEAEKVQFAKDLLELEREGILEWRDGTWGLAEGVEVEETPDGPVTRIRNKEEGSN
jgi:hypothetical protein